MAPLTELPARPVTEDAELDQLLHPARFYERPADVLTDPVLTVAERRAILSSWASDACAVESAPALRRAPFASAPVTFDEIMDAFVQLDGEVSRPAAPGMANRRDAPSTASHIADSRDIALLSSCRSSA
jgi:hypothetical protein